MRGPVPRETATLHRKDLRKGRVCRCPGRCSRDHVTLGRQPIFSDLRAARVLVNALRESQARGEAATLAFVIMPDHMHWLLQLEERVSLSKLVGAVKAVTAHGVGGKIWQGGFHDHALRQEEDLVEVARYIVANPLRAGLAQRVGDYPHWDAVWL